MEPPDVAMIGISSSPSPKIYSLSPGPSPASQPSDLHTPATKATSPRAIGGGSQFSNLTYNSMMNSPGSTPELAASICSIVAGSRRNVSTCRRLMNGWIGSIDGCMDLLMEDLLEALMLVSKGGIDVVRMENYCACI